MKGRRPTGSLILLMGAVLCSSLASNPSSALTSDESSLAFPAPQGSSRAPGTPCHPTVMAAGSPPCRKEREGERSKWGRPSPQLLAPVCVKPGSWWKVGFGPSPLEGEGSKDSHLAWDMCLLNWGVFWGGAVFHPFSCLFMRGTCIFIDCFWIVLEGPLLLGRRRLALRQVTGPPLIRL